MCWWLFVLYNDVHPSLDCGRGEDALRAAQLCLLLLESTSRDELRRLLGFMAAAADNEAFRLHKQVNKSSIRINNSFFVFGETVDIIPFLNKKKNYCNFFLYERRNS